MALVVLTELIISFLYLVVVSTEAVDKYESIKIKKELVYNVKEELQGPSVALGSIAVDSRLSSKYEPSVLRTFSYHVLEDHALGSDLFSVDERSSILRTTSRIDRDALCLKHSECTVTLNVEIRPLEYSTVIKVIIHILDDNDHAPMFPEFEMPLHIAENSEPGSKWVIPPAVDNDSSQFGVIDYNLPVNGNGKFSLEVIDSALRPGEVEIKLVLEGHLDREERPSYDLEIVAYDGGEPARSGSLILHVLVDDINDNNPKFSNASYEFYVIENLPIGSICAIHLKWIRF